MNGHWGSATGGSWTAISRAPWLRALVLFGKGDCWHGGGLFTSGIGVSESGSPAARIVRTRA